jgi:hypothetical protein
MEWRTPNAPLSYDAHLQVIVGVLVALGIRSRAKTHMGHKSGIKLAKESG